MIDAEAQRLRAETAELVNHRLGWCVTTPWRQLAPVHRAAWRHLAKKVLRKTP